MLHERLQRACIEVVVVDGAIVNDKIDGRRNRRVAASRPIYSGQRSDARSSSRRRGEFGEQLAFIVLIVGMQIEDRETGPNINRKNRRHPRSGSMQARHYRTNAVIQAGRHRHVQVGGDSFAGDCRGKDWMRRELITVGWPVQELELLIRERQQREPASRLQRSSHVNSRSALSGLAQPRSHVGIEPRQQIEIDRDQMVARSGWRPHRGLIRKADLDLETTKPRNLRGGGRQLRAIADQPALWPGQTRGSWRLPRRWRWIEIVVHLRVVHWNPVSLRAPATARSEAAV